MLVCFLLFFSNIPDLDVQTFKKEILWVAVDDSFQGKVLEAELTREWNHGRMDHYQDYINSRCNLIIFNYQDPRDLAKYPEIVFAKINGPSFRIGKIGNFTKIDKRAFKCSGNALQTMAAHVYDFLREIEKRAFHCKKQEYEYLIDKCINTSVKKFIKDRNITIETHPEFFWSYTNILTKEKIVYIRYEKVFQECDGVEFIGPDKEPPRNYYIKFPYGETKPQEQKDFWYNCNEL